MKLNKKGFTLIELLAVIVILAIIALIAVPQVISILNKSRKSAAEDSAYGILKSAESYVATYMMDHQGDWAGSVTFTFSDSGVTADPTSASLDFKGTKPTAGVVTLDSNGQATITTGLVINGFTCTQSVDTVTCANS